MKTIMILATLDTKWQEAEFLKQKIQHYGFNPLLMDIGLRGEPSISADIAREQIRAASRQRITNSDSVGSDRESEMQTVIRGAGQILRELGDQSKLAGAICIGGITGTRIGTSILKLLPFGMPKVAVSSTASLKGFASDYIGTSDIVLFHSVIEFGGLNDLMTNVLTRAAGAVCGMAEHTGNASALGQSRQPMLAMTQWGPCEVCAAHTRRELERQGYQVVGFPANGTGDRAMEEIIERQGLFRAVIDLAPGAVGEELLGFARGAGPSRMESAGRRGIAQVIAPSGVNYGTPPKNKYKPEYAERKRHDYDALRTFIRLSDDELRMVARVFAAKLNAARGPVKVVIPLGGWSSVDRQGSDFHDYRADAVFVQELKQVLHPDVELVEVDADLDTPEFSNAIVHALEQIERQRG